MQRCQQFVAGDWLNRTTLPWQQLVGFGPAGFDQYVRVRYLPDPQFEGQSDTDALNALGDEEHPEDAEIARRALSRLESFTGTPQDCYVCVWQGFLEPTYPGPWFALPNRSYALWNAPLDEIARWDQPAVIGTAPAPSFVWPADHRWCFASDVDPHWAGIGCAQDAADALLAEPGIDVVRTDFTTRPPAYT